MRVRRMVFLGVAVVTSALPSQPLRTKSPVRRPLLDKLERCRVPGLDEEVLCGRHEVAESRAVANSRRLSLNIVVLPATTDSVIVPACRSSGPVSHWTEYVAVSPTRNGMAPGGGGGATFTSSRAASLVSVQTTS